MPGLCQLCSSSRVGSRGAESSAGGGLAKRRRQHGGAQRLTPHSPSFPSGHATKSMGLALPFVIMALNKDPITKIFKILISLFAILVCYSRIALQKHFLSDVLAGIAIALFFVFTAVWVVNCFYKRRNMDDNKLSFMNKRLGFIFAVLAILLSVI